MIINRDEITFLKKFFDEQNKKEELEKKIKKRRKEKALKKYKIILN